MFSVEVPLPDLEEQKRLANRVEGVLATMEATRRSGDSRCPVLGELPWAAVGSKFRDLGARWESRRLDSVVLINPEAWNAQTEKNSTFRYADIGSVLNGRGGIAEVHELSVDDAPMRARRVIRAGDIMISTVRPNLRGTALVPGDLDGVVCSTGFAVLRPVEVVPEYLFVQMLSPTIVDQLAIDAHGGHYPAITDSRLRQTQLVVPPANVQKATAEHLIGVLQLAWRLDAVQHRASSLVDALSISVLNYAFAGLMR
ncbi:MAG: restriction endonuclease subunit S domain-containing protein [Mycobacteriales bacterium]